MRVEQSTSVKILGARVEFAEQARIRSFDTCSCEKAPAGVNHSSILSGSDNGLYYYKLKEFLLRRIARWYDDCREI